MNGSVVALSLATISSISRCNPEKSRGMFAQLEWAVRMPEQVGKTVLCATGLSHAVPPSAYRVCESRFLFQNVQNVAPECELGGEQGGAGLDVT